MVKLRNQQTYPMKEISTSKRGRTATKRKKSLRAFVHLRICTCEFLNSKILEVQLKEY